jgi:DNA-binding CsgD family transcriptional regulator
MGDGRRARERGLVVGREAEVGAMAELLAVARHTPLALVLDGEPGIGKTTLVESTLATARDDGFVVLSCRPARAETAFSFAALADLLGPLLPGGLARLPSPQRRALAAALLLEEVEGRAPEERAIAFAVVQLLGEARGKPLLVAIDDAQWLDAASAAVLAFAFRRLSAAVAILVARRAGSGEPAPLGLDGAFPDERLRWLQLGALSVGATHRLLRERLGVSFPRPTLLDLHRTSGGNPFYALELARALERSRRTIAGRRLTVPRSLTELVSARLAALPRTVRGVLEPVALLSAPTVSIIEAVVPDGETVRARLRVAESAGILELAAERIRFTHPLLGARVEAELEPRRQRSLHRRLAELVGDPEQRARHLARGASGPSETVADELEMASASAGLRGASAAAAELADLSVSLTPPETAGWISRRRQLLAADHHHASGDVERSQAILGRLIDQLPPGEERAAVLLRHGERSYDDLEQAELLLERAFVEAEPDRRLRAEIVTARVHTAFHRHGPAAAVRLARDSAEVVEASGDLVQLTRFLAQRGFAELNADGVTPGLLERALELEQQVGPLQTHTTPTRVEGVRLMYADQHERAREALRRAHAIGVARGDVPQQTTALFHLAVLECRAGEWSRADELAEELLEAGEQRGLEFRGGMSLWIRGLVDAYLGRLDQAQARASEGLSRSHEEDEHRFLERNLALLGLIDLSRGDHVAAAARLAPLVRRLEERGTREPSLYPARELAIEALVTVGELGEARVQLDWLEEAGRRLGTPWPLAMGARCRGLLQAAEGDLEAALASCRRALTIQERLPVPFEHARTLLIYGTMLRRSKRRKAARETIATALAIFEALPAPVWAGNASAELARIGGRASSGDGLTPGERRIAELVAAGKSNKEAAAALFLSVHTVEDALKRVYRKLGVHSRTELSRRLTAGS